MYINTHLAVALQLLLLPTKHTGKLMTMSPPHITYTCAYTHTCQDVLEYTYKYIIIYLAAPLQPPRIPTIYAGELTTTSPPHPTRA